MKWISNRYNIWKFIRPTFHAFSPPFRGLNINSERIKDPKVIVEKLGNHYEQHFSEPTSVENNPVHQKYLNIYNKIAYLPSIPLDKITINEVVREWKKISLKKSTVSRHQPFY